MIYKAQTCPIWGVPLDAPITQSQHNLTWIVLDSPRAGGGYRLSIDASLNELTPEEKARLTTWLIDQRELGTPMPEVTPEALQNAKNRRSLPVDERAHRLLLLIGRHIDQVGKKLSVTNEDLDFYGWTESLEWHEVSYCCEYLVQAGLAKARIGPDSIYACEIMVAGYKHIANQRTNVDSSQAFVAMWFDQSMVEVYPQGIAPGIRDAGFKPLRIDQKEHINKIDDEIIAEIRKSRFLVVDFTQGSDGARGGVYYEAGFAQGLGLPVIFTCRQDCVSKLHFDTNHFNHLVWTSPEELRKMLANRIVAVLDQGPLVNP